MGQSSLVAAGADWVVAVSCVVVALAFVSRPLHQLNVVAVGDDDEGVAGCCCGRRAVGRPCLSYMENAVCQYNMCIDNRSFYRYFFFKIHFVKADRKILRSLA